MVPLGNHPWLLDGIMRWPATYSSSYNANFPGGGWVLLPRQRISNYRVSCENVKGVRARVSGELVARGATR